MDIKLDLNFYNKKEEALFKNYSNIEVIQNKINQGISIPEDEFLTYMMFTEQKDFNGWRTYKELKQRVQNRLGDVNDYLAIGSNSVQSRFPAKDIQAANLTERLGVSLGLNAINQIHDFTEADWAITPDQYFGGKRVKDFDYSYPLSASSDRYVLVENKGSVVEDNSKKSSSISQHYLSIKSKKKSILKTGNSSNNIHYGTISVLDSENNAKVWLVDPPSFEMEWSAEKFKLIARLSFYYNLFKIIGIKRQITEALEERIIDLVKTDDIYKFDKKNLPKPNQRNYLSSKHIVKINLTEAFGRFFTIKNNQQLSLYIIALTNRIIKLILNQDFKEILKYNYKNADVEGKVSIELEDKSKEENIETLDKLGFVLDKKRGFFKAQFNRKLRHTSSGRIFGMIE